jgi:hypothetical protein
MMLLVGCATTTYVQVDITPTTFASFDYRDERPNDQRTSAKSNEPYGYGEITRLGDDRITPTPPVLLKTRLQQTLSKAISGKTVVLQEFSIRIFDSKVAGRSASNATSFLWPLNAIGVGNAIDDANTSKTIDVRISGKVGNRDFSGRSSNGIKGPASDDAVKAAILEALDAAVVEVGRISQE